MLEDLEAFVAGSKPTLRKGGYFIHVFPCKFAPFALINQALPDAFQGGCCTSSCLDVYLSYYQSWYFDFFVALYLASALYEMLVWALGPKDLCAHMLVVARKN